MQLVVLPNPSPQQKGKGRTQSCCQSPQGEKGVAELPYQGGVVLEHGAYHTVLLVQGAALVLGHCLAGAQSTGTWALPSLPSVVLQLRGQQLVLEQEKTSSPLVVDLGQQMTMELDFASSSLASPVQSWWAQ